MKRFKFFLVSTLFSVKALGYGFHTPSMPSSFLKVSTPHTHLIDRNGSGVLLRGGTPRNRADLESLIRFGVFKILIFKNESKSEVFEEISDLLQLQFPKENIVHIPMRWKDFASFRDQCQMTLTALQEIEQTLQKQKSLYFHCTVGDDRTGYLAALWRFWRNPNLGKSELFLKEMCDRGYEARNPNKPKANVQKIRAFLTPLYLSMFDLLQEARLKGLALGQIQCPDIDFIPDFDMSYPCP